MGADLLACWHPDRRAGPHDLRVVEPDGVDEAAAELDDDGVLVVRVGRWGRARATRRIRGAGFVVHDEVVLVPTWPDVDHVAALGAPLGDAGSRHLGMRPVVARLLGALTGTRAGRAMLGPLLPHRALVAGRTGGAGGSASASRSHRRDATTATVLRFPPGERRPDRVVKVGLDAGGVERVVREHRGLEHVAPGLAATGIDVPRLVTEDALGSVATTPLDGTPLSALLRRGDRDGRADRALDRLVASVASWHEATHAEIDLTGERALSWVLGPADVVAGALADDADVGALRAALRRADDAWNGRPVPSVACHGDLTTWNVLVAGDRVGVVDWEAAESDGLPGADLWYLMVDAEVTGSGATHAEAAVALAEGRLPRGDDVVRACAGVGLTGPLLDVAFHACWLQHAADEVHRGSPGPFIEVVRALVARRLRWPG